MGLNAPSLQSIFQMLVFIFPAYVANSAPVVFGGGLPIDFRKNFFDKKRIFGDGKTFRGFAFGLLLGTITGGVLASFFDVYGLAFGEKTILAFMLSFGTLVGDAFGSFIKRRQGLKRGERSFLADQLLFLVFALSFAFAYKPALLAQLTWEGIAVLLVITLFLHKFFNEVAHSLQLKKVPW